MAKNDRTYHGGISALSGGILSATLDALDMACRSKNLSNASPDMRRRQA
jgi:hypothetical protein